MDQQTIQFTTSFQDWKTKVSEYDLPGLVFPPESEEIGRYATAPAILIDNEPYVMRSTKGTNLSELLSDTDILYMILSLPNSEWIVRGVCKKKENYI